MPYIQAQHHHEKPMLLITEDLQFVFNHHAVESARAEQPKILRFAQIRDLATTAKHQFFSLRKSRSQLHPESHFVGMHVQQHLIVGIGGGILSRKTDIHLGEVEKADDVRFCTSPNI